ncbi:MAG TPA: carboxypeptidase-like regulatory domain-containing protein [Bryobacteraceae bacterium]|nr:carboxypeptidase-like regulatory domain-containing protein [Bryobacteraceae bacterium]
MEAPPVAPEDEPQQVADVEAPAVQPKKKSTRDQARLKVMVFEEDDQTKVIVAAQVTSSLVGLRQTQMNGIADFGQVPTGEHSIKVMLQGNATKVFLPPGPVAVTLRDRDNITVPVPVQPIASWIEIRLVDLDGSPVAQARYELRLPDGNINQGALDENGSARFDGIKPGQAQVRFPDIDAREWSPAGAS